MGPLPSARSLARLCPWGGPSHPSPIFQLCPSAAHFVAGIIKGVQNEKARVRIGRQRGVASLVGRRGELEMGKGKKRVGSHLQGYPGKREAGRGTECIRDRGEKRRTKRVNGSHARKVLRGGKRKKRRGEKNRTDGIERHTIPRTSEGENVSSATKRRERKKGKGVERCIGLSVCLSIRLLVGVALWGQGGTAKSDKLVQMPPRRPEKMRLDQRLSVSRTATPRLARRCVGPSETLRKGAFPRDGDRCHRSPTLSLRGGGGWTSLATASQRAPLLPRSQSRSPPGDDVGGWKKTKRTRTPERAAPAVAGGGGDRERREGPRRPGGCGKGGGGKRGSRDARVTAVAKERG